MSEVEIKRPTHMYHAPQHKAVENCEHELFDFTRGFDFYRGCHTHSRDNVRARVDDLYYARGSENFKNK